jgi:hypothetical protein
VGWNPGQIQAWNRDCNFSWNKDPCSGMTVLPEERRETWTLLFIHSSGKTRYQLFHQ